LPRPLLLDFKEKTAELVSKLAAKSVAAIGVK
jgi:hypothetical protein